MRNQYFKNKILSSAFLSLVFSMVLVLNSLAQSDSCLEFDGIDDYILVGDVNNLDTTDFTIEAWINISAPNGNGNKIINKGLTTVGFPANAGYGLRASKMGVDEIDFTIAGANGEFKVLTYNGIQPDTWYHIAGVRHGTNLYLYLNGNLVDADSSSIVLNTNTDIPLAIGAIDKGPLSTTNEFMNGLIDEVRIWNRALSSKEIGIGMHCAKTAPEVNLLAVYNLNEGSGLVTTDASGFDNDGDFIDSPVWLDSPVAPVCQITSASALSTGEGIHIYPNPTTDFINITDVFDNSISYYVSTVDNKIVKSGIIQNNRIDVSDLHPGLYILSINRDNRLYLEKFIKQ